VGCLADNFQCALFASYRVRNQLGVVLAAIYFAPVSNCKDEHGQLRIIYLVDDSVIADSSSIEIRFAREFHAARRPRIPLKAIDRSSQSAIQACIPQAGEKFLSAPAE
jgi:hypothetical protein